MTDNEIIKGLECCLFSYGQKCEECPYKKHKPYVISTTTCSDKMRKDALDLINRQKAEIEMLNEKVDFVANISQLTQTIKIEAIKEFAERVKATPLRCGVEYREYYDKPSIYKLVPFVDDNDIDNLVKEMEKKWWVMSDAEVY